MIRQEKTVTVYKADDGKEFLTQAECEDYERDVLALKKDIKYFVAAHSPDLTEGRGFFGKTLFAVYDPSGLQFERVLQFMIEKFGRTVDYVQGVSPTQSWTVPREVGEDDFFDSDLPKKSSRVFISQKAINGYGFMEPVWVK